MKSIPSGWYRVAPNDDPLAPTDRERFYDQRSLWEAGNYNFAFFQDLAR